MYAQFMKGNVDGPLQTVLFLMEACVYVCDKGTAQSIQGSDVPLNSNAYVVACQTWTGVRWTRTAAMATRKPLALVAAA
jgi:hypothetical protein